MAGGQIAQSRLVDEELVPPLVLVVAPLAGPVPARHACPRFVRVEHLPVLVHLGGENRKYQLRGNHVE